MDHGISQWIMTSTLRGPVPKPQQAAIAWLGERYHQRTLNVLKIASDGIF